MKGNILKTCRAETPRTSKHDRKHQLTETTWAHNSYPISTIGKIDFLCLITGKGEPAFPSWCCQGKHKEYDVKCRVKWDLKTCLCFPFVNHLIIYARSGRGSVGRESTCFYVCLRPFICESAGSVINIGKRSSSMKTVLRLFESPLSDGVKVLFFSRCSTQT